MHPGKEPSPLARVQTMSVGAPTTTTTQVDFWSIDDDVRNHNSVGMKRPYLHELSFEHSHYGVA